MKWYYGMDMIRLVSRGLAPAALLGLLALSSLVLRAADGDSLSGGMGRAYLGFGALPPEGASKPSHPRDGELYRGLSKYIPNERVIVPYGLEVGFGKTTHILFPAAVRYVDLGSTDIIAGQAEDAVNVLRVKSSVRGFAGETNLSVVCEDGAFYSFNVRYAEEPRKLSVEMQDFLSSSLSGGGRLPSNRMEVRLRELGRESPTLVGLIMRTIHQNDRRTVKHLGARQFGLRLLLRGLYAHNGLLYFHLRLDNSTHAPYDIDLISFRVIDRVVAKRVATQELSLQPLRMYNGVLRVEGKSTVRTVLAFDQFTLADGKQLEISLYERGGGRRLAFLVQQEDLQHAAAIGDLRLEFR